MNTFRKYCPNVFVAQCTEQHQKGELIILTTKYGKEVENEVHNYLGQTKDGFFLYSIMCKSVVLILDNFRGVRQLHRRNPQLKLGMVNNQIEQTGTFLPL